MFHKKLVRFVPPIAALACIGFAAISPAPARADRSVGVGYFAPGPDTKTLGVVATAGLSLPIVPIAPQIAVAVPLSGGRYAVTGEARVGTGSTTIGAGAGIARLNSTGQSGAIFDVFAGHRIAPLTSVEVRYYGFGGASVGSTGYIGLRVGI